MKELIDKQNGVIVLVPEVENPGGAYPIFISSDLKSMRDFRRQLDNCADINRPENSQYKREIANIKKFICNFAELGTFLEWAIIDSKRICYVIDQASGDLISAMLVDPNIEIELYRLKHLINFKSSFEQISEYSKSKRQQVIIPTDEEYQMYKKAIIAIEKGTSTNNLNLDYLVATPYAQHKGIGAGSRTVASLLSNREFFAPNDETLTICTQVHRENSKCLHMMNKNGFFIFGDNSQNQSPLNELIYVDECMG